VIAFGAVPPIAGGDDKSKVPPSVRLPLAVTVPVNVKPFTVPAPDTLVTVPTLIDPPRLVDVPLIVIALFANWAFDIVPLRSVVGMVLAAVSALVPLPFT
jgi:hypothetical protein